MVNPEEQVAEVSARGTEVDPLEISFCSASFQKMTLYDDFDIGARYIAQLVIRNRKTVQNGQNTGFSARVSQMLERTLERGLQGSKNLKKSR